MCSKSCSLRTNLYVLSFVLGAVLCIFIVFDSVSVMFLNSHQLVFSIALVPFNRNITLYEVATSKIVSCFFGHTDVVSSVRFSSG